MQDAFWQDRFWRRFLWGSVLFSLSFWGVANLDGVPAYAAILPMVVGLIAAMSGLFWVGSERGVEQPGGAVESRFPIGHVLCGCLLAIGGGAIALFCLFGGAAGDPVIIRILGAIPGFGIFVLGCAAGVHCYTYRVFMKAGEIWSSGGLRPSLRKGPYKLEEISKRQGVFLTDKSPRTYQIRFIGKRWIDLNSHMTGTQPILAAAASFYPHDYAYDDCLVRKVNV